MPRKRIRVIYSGRVQGVGFRYTCERLSRGFPVVGHVRNLPEGSVEVVVEGDSEPVDTFLSAIEAAMGRKIQDINPSPENPPEVPEESFFIRY